MRVKLHIQQIHPSDKYVEFLKKCHPKRKQKTMTQDKSVSRRNQMANTVQSTQSTQSQSQSKSNKNAMDVVKTGIKIEYDSVQHGAKPAISVIGRITLNWYAE